jgi:hypothetical protein
MGFLDRAKMAFGLDGAEAREERQERSERDEQWGRITAIKSKVGPAVTVEVTIYGGRQTQTATIMSVPPLKHEPRVGDDIAVSIRVGQQSVDHEWQIDWNDPPQYGVPTPTQQQLQDAAVPGLLTDDPSAASPTSSRLADAERMRDAGEVSEAAFQTMKANILGPAERIERMHDSGEMSDEIYAKVKASEARFAAGVRIGTAPTPEQAFSNLDHAMDDSDELDLQRRGTMTSATVVALPTADATDRFKMEMPLDVTPPNGGVAYRVDCVFPAARPVDLLEVGTTLPVKVDPEDPRHVAVIWNRWLVDRGQS